MSKRLLHLPVAYNIVSLFFVLLLATAGVYMLILFWPRSNEPVGGKYMITQHPASAGVPKK